MLCPILWSLQRKDDLGTLICEAMRYRDVEVQQATAQITGLSEPQFSHPENESNTPTSYECREKKIDNNRPKA